LERITTTNSTYKKLAVQWLNEALCFVSSLVVVDSFVLTDASVSTGTDDSVSTGTDASVSTGRNRQLLVAANRQTV